MSIEDLRARVDDVGRSNEAEHREIFSKLDRLVFVAAQIAAAQKQILEWQAKNNSVAPRVQILESRWRFAGWTFGALLGIVGIVIGALKLSG